VPAVTVTIVLFESAGTLPRCLAALATDLIENRIELVAVDNGSPDESAEILLREFPEARLIRAAENRGFAAGTNLAWPLVRTTYWMLLNPDVVLPPGGVGSLVEWMDGHPEIGAASPRIAQPGGTVESPGRALPSLGRTMLELSRLHRLLSPRMRARIFGGPYWGTGDQLDAGWVPGTAMIVRGATVKAAGLLSEDFFMYGEDIEWCWRIRRAGWRIGVCDRVTVVHAEASSARRRWSEEELQLRMAAGVRLACAKINGRLRACLFSLATAAALAVESIHPRRSADQRRRARTGAQAWIQARDPIPP
jgi:N-acetylglucosaminyl-diphospho-decaprenol L-rhamnosyltransferase